MLQNLSQEIRECLRRVEECTRLAKTAVTAGAINAAKVGNVAIRK
jgi:hypothetical protein